MTQLALDLPLRPALGREDFVVSPGAAPALALLDDWARWPSGRAALTGPQGSGKSHLAHVWAEAAGARVAEAGAAPGLAADLARGGGPPALALEDAAPEGPAAEAALLHLMNAAAEARRPLLLTGRAPPARWRVALPDLASRLAATLPIEVPPPDDALLTALLAKHFADRQIAPPRGLVSWLALRIERSAAAAQDAVARLDAAALERGRDVSVPLAREVLRL